MRFKNTTDNVRYVTYATNAGTGRRLSKDQVSGEVGPSCLFDKYLVRDVMSGRTVVILTGDEKKYLETLVNMNKGVKVEKEVKKADEKKPLPKMPPRLVGPDGAMTHSMPNSNVNKIGQEFSSEKYAEEKAAEVKKELAKEEPKAETESTKEPEVSTNDKKVEKTEKPKRKKKLPKKPEPLVNAEGQLTHTLEEKKVDTVAPLTLGDLNS